MPVPQQLRLPELTKLQLTDPVDLDALAAS